MKASLFLALTILASSALAGTTEDFIGEPGSFSFWYWLAILGIVFLMFGRGRKQ